MTKRKLSGADFFDRRKVSPGERIISFNFESLLRVALAAMKRVSHKMKYPRVSPSFSIVTLVKRVLRLSRASPAKSLISVDSHGKSVVPHPDVFVNVGRTLVPFVAVRTFEPRFLATIVLQVRVEGLLIGVTSVATRTMIGHLSRVPERITLAFHVHPTDLHVSPQDVEEASIVRRQG